MSTGFKLAAELCGVESRVANELTDEWPTSAILIALALNSAGFPAGANLIETANTIYTVHPDISCADKTFDSSEGRLPYEQFKHRLVQLLLNCPIMSRNREDIVHDLSFGAYIPYNGIPKVHVAAIVEACLSRENGLAELIRNLKFMDGGTIAFRQLKDFLNLQ